MWKVDWEYFFTREKIRQFKISVSKIVIFFQWISFILLQIHVISCFFSISWQLYSNSNLSIYLLPTSKCMYFVFQCSLVVVTVEWYDNRIIGDFKFFLCTICLICQLKNPSHHCSAQNPNIEWMDFSRNLLLRKKKSKFILG